MYQITNYTKQKAKELNVKIKPSSNPKKKIDVYKDNKKVASVGAMGYDDYPNYIIKKGKSYADEKRRLYKLRHSKDRNVIGTNGYYADKLLW
jgi:hypothetical protein